MKVLAGDIGGTKTLLQIAECYGSRLNVLEEQRFDSAAYEDFSSMVRDFFKSIGESSVGNVCIGVAGPVRDTIANVTNLPWKINALSLQEQFSFNNVRLINDFQAVGYGIDTLSEDDLITLQIGEPLTHGTRAVIGAGTGLGEGILVWQQDRYEVLSSEGGHVHFAPVNDVQTELLTYLRTKLDHVSYEQVCSGPGLENVYEFFLHKSHTLSDKRTTAAEITELALTKNDSVAKLALDTFVNIYGAQAGNLALTSLARGGIFIAGGIAPKIVATLQQGAFMQAFIDKSKMKSLLESIPVHVVINPNVGLMGAAAVAAYYMD